jgi:hypothetical protein
MARSKINPEEVDETNSQNPSEQLVPTQSTAVEPVEDYNPDYYDDVSRDTDVPFLALVGNTGSLASQHRNQSGNFVYNDKIIGPSLDVVPVAVMKFFIEKARDGKEIKFGTPEWKLRKTFETAREAFSEGYVIDFKNKAPNRIEESGRIGYLVVGPEGTEPEDFPLSAGGFRFGLGKSTYNRGGYREVWQRVFDHAVRLSNLRGLPTKGISQSELFNRAQAWDGVWTLTSVQPPMRNGNQWWEPRIAKKAKLPPEVVAWISDNYGNVRA